MPLCAFFVRSKRVLDKSRGLVDKIAFLVLSDCYHDHSRSPQPKQGLCSEELVSASTGSSCAIKFEDLTRESFDLDFDPRADLAIPSIEDIPWLVNERDAALSPGSVPIDELDIIRRYAGVP